MMANIVKIKNVRELLKELEQGFRLSKSAEKKINDVVKDLIEDALSRAKAEGRKTVMPEDFYYKGE